MPALRAVESLNSSADGTQSLHVCLPFHVPARPILVPAPRPPWERVDVPHWVSFPSCIAFLTKAQTSLPALRPLSFSSAFHAPMPLPYHIHCACQRTPRFLLANVGYTLPCTPSGYHALCWPALRCPCIGLGPPGLSQLMLLCCLPSSSRAFYTRSARTNDKTKHTRRL